MRDRERESMRAGEGQRERQTPLPVGSLMRGLIRGLRDHALS